MLKIYQRNITGTRTRTRTRTRNGIREAKTGKVLSVPDIFATNDSQWTTTAALYHWNWVETLEGRAWRCWTSDNQPAAAWQSDQDEACNPAAAVTRLRGMRASEVFVFYQVSSGLSYVCKWLHCTLYDPEKEHIQVFVHLAGFKSPKKSKKESVRFGGGGGEYPWRVALVWWLFDGCLMVVWWLFDGFVYMMFGYSPTRFGPLIGRKRCPGYKGQKSQMFLLLNSLMSPHRWVSWNMILVPLYRVLCTCTCYS